MADNLKVIGLHKGSYNDNSDIKNKINIGIRMNLIINKTNFIKCIYNINNENIGKEIQIINNGHYNFYKRFIKKIFNIKVIINGKIKSNTFKY